MAKRLSSGEKRNRARLKAINKRIRKIIKGTKKQLKRYGAQKHRTEMRARRKASKAKAKARADKADVRGYALYLEFGTPKMAERPYLRRTLYETRNDLVSIMTTPIKMR